MKYTSEEILKDELYTQKGRLSKANEMIAYHTDKWIEAQKIIIDIENTLLKLEKQ